MKELPVRKNIRLKNYDYSNTAYYFITICVKDRHELLWNEPVGTRIARPSLSGIGETVEKAIENIPNIYKSITIDKYVIMPNHIHLILIITNDHTDDHGRAMPNRGGRAMRVPTTPGG